MNTSFQKTEPDKKLAILVIVRYPVWAAFFGFLSMAIFRLPLWLNKKISFWRLMGSGRNGTFDIVPDLKQWAIMVVVPAEQLQNAITENDLNQLVVNFLGKFIARYLSIFSNHRQAILLQPLQGHGTWNGQQAFGNLPKSDKDWQGPLAILTRATIRPGKAKAFWKHVETVANQMAISEGFITSYGIGEIPFIKQATFSVWSSYEAMAAFAYKMPTHKEVVRKTYAEKWYSEDMFTRFRLLKAWNNPTIEAVIESDLEAA